MQFDLAKPNSILLSALLVGTVHAVLDVWTLNSPFIIQQVQNYECSIYLKKCIANDY